MHRTFIKILTSATIGTLDQMGVSIALGCAYFQRPSDYIKSFTSHHWIQSVWLWIRFLPLANHGGSGMVFLDNPPDYAHVSSAAFSATAGFEIVTYDLYDHRGGDAKSELVLYRLVP